MACLKANLVVSPKHCGHPICVRTGGQAPTSCCEGESPAAPAAGDAGSPWLNRVLAACAPHILREPRLAAALGLPAQHLRLALRPGVGGAPRVFRGPVEPGWSWRPASGLRRPHPWGSPRLSCAGQGHPCARTRSGLGLAPAAAPHLLPEPGPARWTRGWSGGRTWTT